MAKLIKDGKQNFIMTLNQSEFDKLPIRITPINEIIDEGNGDVLKVTGYRYNYLVKNEENPYGYSINLNVNKNKDNQFEIKLGRFTEIRQRNLLHEIPLLYDLYKQYKLDKKQERLAKKSKSNNIENQM